LATCNNFSEKRKGIELVAPWLPLGRGTRKSRFCIGGLIF